MRHSNDDWDKVMTTWLGLIIGNSRLHWAQFEGNQLQHTWDTSHFSEDAIASSPTLSTPPIPWPPTLARASYRSLPLVIASVVPTQTRPWLNHPRSVELALEQIELANLYPTMGIDRALAALGAFRQWRSPVLVIDGGTALTFTGIDRDGRLVGGAIAPGLQLQLHSLHDHTAVLPNVESKRISTLSRWQADTANAILSGVWHTLIAGVKDFIGQWRQEFPLSHIVLTGGDGQILYQALSEQKKGGHQRSLHYDPQIGFRGMAIAYAHLLNSRSPD
ncbi:MAG: pantothenate kinase [Leptolyngbyaceae cyanobacterium]